MRPDRDQPASTGQARVVNSALAGPRSRACGAQKHLVASAAPPLPPSAPRHLRLQLLPVARSRGRGELLAREHACSSPACARKGNHAGRLRPKDTTRMRERRNGDVTARVWPQHALSQRRRITRRQHSQAESKAERRPSPLRSRSRTTARTAQARPVRPASPCSGRHRSDSRAKEFCVRPRLSFI